VLGIWIEQTEGAKFWPSRIFARGCEGFLIAVMDGLKGMPEALENVHARIRNVITTRGTFPPMRRRRN
jgi:putative transposase